MNTAGWMTVGILACAALGAIWLVLVRFTGYESGVLSLGLGVAIGLGFRWPAGENCGWLSGTAAMVAAIVILLSGASIVASADRSRTEAEAVAATSDEKLLFAVAECLLQYRIDQGQTVNLPGGEVLQEGMDTAAVEKKEDFPPEIWGEAVSHLNKMSDAEKEKIRQVRTRLAARSTGVGRRTEHGVFGIAALCWSGLSAATAFLVGSRLAV